MANIIGGSEQVHGACPYSLALGRGRIEVMLTGLASPCSAGAPAEVAYVTGSALGIGIYRVPREFLKTPVLKDRRESKVSNVAQVRIWLMVGVAGEGFAIWLDIEILTKSATGHRAETVFDQFHRVDMRAEGFGGGRFFPFLSAAQRQERAEAGAADAKALGEFGEALGGGVAQHGEQAAVRAGAQA